MPELSADLITPARLNIRETHRCAFLLPFFFGLMDGDGNLATANDDMVYLMMFDQAEPIRFALWHWSQDMHRSAWDWQYVIHHPQSGKTYQYKACLLYKPYQGVMDVVDEYVKWVKGLGMPRHLLDITVKPVESGSIFPGNTNGMYGDNIHVYFGVNPSPGWKFDHWEGPVDDNRRRYTSIHMKKPAQVSAVCIPRK
jgi:hypothetical protein